MPRRRQGQPPQAPRGQTYGERQQRIESQQAQPIPDDRQRFTQALEAAQQMGGSGGGGALRRPSDRPDEPITAGLSSGPGPGPEAVQQPQTGRERDPTVVNFASHLPMLEMLASRPGSSVTLRNLVRRLRSMVPADFDFSEAMQQEARVDPDEPSGGLDPDEVA